MKTGLQDRLTGSQRDRVAPDTGPMTGSSNYQQPSTIRGEAQTTEVSGAGREDGAASQPRCREALSASSVPAQR